ncbi:unnamed protein product [Protopolystoma xenopodis]|uniref:Uncharacterized protein n=1 Tax=Protopolystoma xenopodis TaxID=117903 RepID=A0A448XSZ9_9PLAT|nr:unnamed protein product [Protopolystoma xenopodis]
MFTFNYFYRYLYYRKRNLLFNQRTNDLFPKSADSPIPASVNVSLPVVLTMEVALEVHFREALVTLRPEVPMLAQLVAQVCSM